MSTFSSQEKMLFNAGFLHVAFYKVLQRRLIDLGGDTTHMVLTPGQPYPLYYYVHQTEGRVIHGLS